MDGTRSSQNEECRALGICRVIMDKKGWRRGKLGGEMAANILTSSASPFETGNAATNSTGSFMDCSRTGTGHASSRCTEDGNAPIGLERVNNG